MVVKCAAPVDNLMAYIRSQVAIHFDLPGCYTTLLFHLQFCAFALMHGWQVRCTYGQPCGLHSQSSGFTLRPAWLLRNLIGSLANIFVPAHICNAWFSSVSHL